MNSKERSDFEKLFRHTLERGSLSEALSEAEAMLREAIFRLDDSTLKAIIERPVEETYIDRWSVINAAMNNARDGVADGKMAAMILGLIHRNSASLDMTIAISFAKVAAPAPFKEIPRFPSIQTEEQYQELVKEARAHIRLPQTPHYKPAWIDPAPRLIGMELVQPGVDREYGGGEGWERQHDQINTAKMLGAALVFLRFCQAAERHLNADTSTTRLQTYLTVEATPWPMETGTIDYCSHAVRLVPARRGINWDKFKAFVMNRLRPDNLLTGLREQRLRQPNYGYCNFPYDRFSSSDAAEIGLNDFIRRAKEDDDIRAALAHISGYGFQVSIGTYEEPGRRELHISVKQNEEAERTMCMMERLD